MTSVAIGAFYKFATVDDPATLRDDVRAKGDALDVLGTVLVATEGINGTVAAAPAHLDEFFAWLRSDPRFADLTVKHSLSDSPPFKVLKVRLKPEIVTLRKPVDPRTSVGTYVEPHEWNAVVDDPDVIVIDTRNREEIELGTFAGSVDPGTESFTEFVGFAATLDPTEHPTVAMFCTGGIRCEKASSYLLSQGFNEVLHLRGGILQYLEDVPADDSRWVGECFVFDDRVSVDHDLRPGTHTLCRSCSRPLSPQDRESPAYEHGVSCAYCADRLTDARRASLRERHRQELAARARGERHIGRKATS